VTYFGALKSARKMPSRTNNETIASTIYLLLVGQNSVVFNFGHRYDKRNLPDVIVYQYEGDNPKRFPWGVRMPILGQRVPSIVRT